MNYYPPDGYEDRFNCISQATISELSKLIPQWIPFEQQKPEPLQEIMIRWARPEFEPEYRKLTEKDLLRNWDGIFWMPLPDKTDNG